jgi:hypothetical protein
VRGSVQVRAGPVSRQVRAPSVNTASWSPPNCSACSRDPTDADSIKNLLQEDYNLL